MSTDLEERLRTTFDAVMPLLCDDGGDVILPPAALAVVAPRRDRRLLVAACVALIVTTVAIIAVAGHHDAVPPVNSSPETSGATTTAVVAADAPEWYRWIKPFLPAGFDDVGVTTAGGGSIWYVAIDPTTNLSLDILLQSGDALLGATPPAGTDPIGELTESATGYFLNARSGVHVEVECGIGNWNSSLDSETDYCAGGLDLDARRSMTLAIAAGFPFDMLDGSLEALTPGDVDLDAVTTLMQSVLPDQVWQGQGDGSVVFDVAGQPLAGTTATILQGVYGPDAITSTRVVAYGDSSVEWLIRHGTAVRLLSNHTGTDFPGVLSTLAGDIMNVALGGSFDEQTQETSTTFEVPTFDPPESQDTTTSVPG